MQRIDDEDFVCEGLSPFCFNIFPMSYFGPYKRTVITILTNTLFNDVCEDSYCSMERNTTFHKS